MTTATLATLRSALSEQAIALHPWHGTLRAAADRVNAPSAEALAAAIAPEPAPEPALGPVVAG